MQINIKIWEYLWKIDFFVCFSGASKASKEKAESGQCGNVRGLGIGWWWWWWQYDGDDGDDDDDDDDDDNDNDNDDDDDDDDDDGDDFNSGEI